VEQDLLEEVRNLVEFPTVFYGEFERDFLKLPEEVLITSMKEHQRYFPVFNKEQDALLAFFVSVRNGDNKRLDNVIRGKDRKSTRLNSSHVSISYAVICLNTKTAGRE